MTPYQKEELENIRKAAENGRAAAQPYIFNDKDYCRVLDQFQHILDIVERIKETYG